MQPEMLLSNNNPIYIVQHNHFDPIWRRCWNRTFDYKGRRYRPYAELEELFIDIWLENAKRGAVFSEGQAVVIRKYLERNPDRLPEMQELAKKGLLELTAAGETVADTNMPSGETLLRNLVMGQLYFEDTFGVIPGVGWLEDAFGQSAQIPQIFRGCECKQALKLSYKAVPGPYWRGLDGSVIYTGDSPHSHYAGGGIKIPPCHQCQGYGCEACADRPGLADASNVSDEEVARALRRDFQGEPFSMLLLGGEEAVPNPNLPELVEQARRETGLDFRYGGFNKIGEYFAEQIARVDDPDVPAPDQVEANPVSTGCYVTRIRIKQEFRRIENAINAAERWAAVAHAMGGSYAIECLTEGWRQLLFCAFHDALTSTHIDAAYYELLDMLAEAECEAGHVMDHSLEFIESHVAAKPDRTYLVVYNSESWERDDPVTVTLTGAFGCPQIRDHTGKQLDVLDVAAEGEDVTLTFRPPKIGPLGYAAVEVIPDASIIDSGELTSGPGQVENEYFTIAVSEAGITSIFDKRLGTEILDTSAYLGGELILEEDIGHPWGTMQPPSFEERLSAYTTGVSIRRASKASEIVLTGLYKGKDPNVKLLSWRQSVKLYAGVDRIDFAAEIDWDTAQRRIRVAFPTNIKASDGMYAIPYGAVKRWKYEPEMDRLPSTNGDWPAINWVDTYGEGENRGVALINTGTPSHKIEDGVIYMSLLRSPTDSWCLNEPEFYDCPDFDGARDSGTHEFAYSLVSHAGDYRQGSVEKRAREINNPLYLRQLSHSGTGSLPLAHSFMKMDATDNVIVTAVKKCERDDSLIVRLAETAGAPGEASVSIEGAGGKISVVNFLERDPKPLSGKISLGPWKIATLKLG